MSSGRVSVGHPVDVGTGAVFTFAHDFQIGGAVELLWRRHYSTAVKGKSWLGRKWTVPYFTFLQRQADGYILNGAHGEQVFFKCAQPLRAGSSVSNLASNMELRRDGQGYCVLHWHHGSDFRRFCFGGEPRNDRFPLTSQGNLAGHNVRVEYNRAGRPVALVQELEQRVFEIAYNFASLIDRITYLGRNEKKLLVNYEYDQRERLLVVSNALGHRTVYEYDAEDRMTAETSPSGSRFRFEYDRLGRCTYTAGEDGYLERKLRYSQTPLMTKVTDSRGGVTQYHLNPAGQVVQIVKPLGAVTTNTFDEHGRLTGVTHPDGSKESRSYDDRGNVAQTADACGNVTSFQHDDQHVRTRIIDRNGNAWIPPNKFEGSIADVRDLPKRLWNYEFDARGLATQAYSLAGWTIRIERDAQLGWQERRDDIGLIQRKKFDELGRVVEVTDRIGPVSATRYDDLHRPIEVIVGSSEVTRYEWNAIGKITGRFGPGLQSETWQYDVYGNLVAHTDASGLAVGYEYDREGNLTAIINRAGERLEYRHDLQGRIVEEKFFDGRIQRYEYDFADRQITIHLSDGRTINQTFDKVGLLSRRSSSDGLADLFQYDKEGRVIQASNTHASVKIQRDCFGRVVHEAQNGRLVSYRYDLDGNRLLRMLALGVTGCDLQFNVDSRGRLVSFIDELGICQQWRWDDADRLLGRSCPGGLAEEFRYDPDRHLSEHRLEASNGSSRTSYRYDGNGNLRELTQTGDGTLVYRYDALDRVQEVRRNGIVVESYIYDANNSISETHRGRRSLAPGGKVLADGKRTLFYGSDGAISSIQSGEQTWWLKHDVNSRLVEVASNSGKPIHYEYDALGRRVAKTVGAERTELLWDGQSLLAEVEYGKTAAIYLSIDFRPFAQWKDGHRYTPILDCRGAVQQVYDERQQRWKCLLDSYGNVLSAAGDGPSPFRLRGQYYDAESGFHYNFHRYYDPQLGDFTAPDPLGMRGGLHLYAYPRNPLRWNDPLGLDCKKPENHPEEEEPPGTPQKALADMTEDELKEHVLARAQALQKAFEAVDPDKEAATTLSVGVVQDKDGDPSTRKVVVTTSADNQQLPQSVKDAMLPGEEPRSTDPTIKRSPPYNNPDYDENKPPDNRNNPKTKTDPVIVDPDTGQKQPYDKDTQSQHHAEQRMENGADKNNENVLAQQPTKPCCDGCKTALGDNGLSKVPDPGHTADGW